MKMYFVLSLAMLVLAPVIWGQDRPTTPPTATQAKEVAVPVAKIAVVDSRLFTDEKAGISKLIAAYQQLQREFQPKQQELQTLQTRIKTIADEISKLSAVSPVDPKIQAKQDEGERISRDLKYKKEAAQEAFEKRHAQLVTPIQTELQKALQSFAQARGITMLLDVSQLENSVLMITPAMNVTEAFIMEFNRKAEGTKPN